MNWNKFLLPGILLRGFCMGIADIIPGISGGTVALIVGIYHRLLKALSSVNKEAFHLLRNRQIRALIEHTDLIFLLNIFAGIFIAIGSMSHLVHYLFANYATFTWAFFFGLITASIVFLFFEVENKSIKNLIFIPIGCFIGYGVISLTPTETPEHFLFIILVGFICICAMILPGISGSFLMLILGKYIYITSAVKTIFNLNSLLIVLQFLTGAALGLLTFSKILNFFHKNLNFQNQLTLKTLDQIAVNKCSLPTHD